MRIRWRLTWYGIGFTALSLVAIIVVILLLVQGSAGQDQDTALATIADETAATLTNESVALDGTVAPITPDSSSSDQVFIAVFDESGRPVFWSGTVDGEVLDVPAAVIVEALETGASEADVGPVRVQARAWSGPAGDGGIVVAFQALSIVEEQVLGLRWFLVVFGIVALIAAAIGAWFMAGRALRPLDVLARTTDEIGATGDLSRRLPEVSQDDEVGALTDSFNAMVASLERARDERDRTIEAQHRFVADASHELRSPLTSIRSNAGFLIEQPEASPHDRQEATEDIVDEARRMSDLVDRLLTLARSDAGVPSDGHRTLDLAHVAEVVGRRARNLDLTLHLDAPRAVLAEGDDEALAEAVWILVDNADRHGATQATLSVATEQGQAVIRVDDDGPGIPAVEADLVFDRFYRADVARSGPGHGLGLPIARTIAEAHAGSLSVDASPLGGARFELRLPAVV